MIKKSVLTFFVVWLVLSLHALFYTANGGVGGILLTPFYAPAILKARVEIFCKESGCLNLPPTRIEVAWERMSSSEIRSKFGGKAYRNILDPNGLMQFESSVVHTNLVPRWSAYYFLVDGNICLQKRTSLFPRLVCDTVYHHGKDVFFCPVESDFCQQFTVVRSAII